MTNHLQALMDGLSAEWQRGRAATQMTLGGLIAGLEALPADRQVTGFGEPDSYRGFYEDLAFEPSDGTETVGELLARCCSCIGQVFQGYKGGDFVMGALTPVWMAHYGRTGDRLVGLNTEANPITPRTAQYEG